MNNSIHDDLISFLKKCTDSISSLSKDEHIQEGITKFNSRLKKASNKDFITPEFPVMNKLDSVTESPYLYNFNEIASKLKWRPSPRTDPDAEVIALCSFNEMLNLGDLLAGFMFMTPNQIYPEHGHPPQEVYFVLSGTASWLYGGEETYRQQQPGDIIYNNPKDLHGMKTQNEPLLALYFLWGNKTEGYSY